MELDELKAAWAAMELRQDGMEALLRMNFHAQRTGGIRAVLRPLFWGQLLQLALGVLLSLWGGALWATHVRAPAVLACGLALHAYGLVMIALAARNLYLLGRVDYAAPVLGIQRRIARLRAFRVRVETPVNLVACSFLWIPVAWFALATLGARVSLGGFLAWSLASSVAGVALLAGTAWALRRMGHGRAVAGEAAGRSLRRAEAALDELARFERE